MTPIYFPFTWADASTIQAITAVFPKIAMYRPSVCRAPSLLHPFEQAGGLEIRVPVTEDSDRLEIDGRRLPELGQVASGKRSVIFKNPATRRAFYR